MISRGSNGKKKKKNWRMKNEQTQGLKVGLDN